MAETPRLHIQKNVWFNPFKNPILSIPPDVAAQDAGKSEPVTGILVEYNGAEGMIGLSCKARIFPERPGVKYDYPMGETEFRARRINGVLLVLEAPVFIETQFYPTTPEPTQALHNTRAEIDFHGKLYSLALADEGMASLDEHLNVLAKSGWVQILSDSYDQFRDNHGEKTTVLLPWVYERQEETLDAFERIRMRFVGQQLHEVEPLPKINSAVERGRSQDLQIL